ncbi:5'-methylthioadenosine/S-adenosylhomocysteine nucleosidase [Paraglaciecola mesophila KMM 241]|uniref:5'-methylthioadenosine/S-adenosylhomocysteine nucleosidase n=1 Tax=Paraglaciecola mesophila KMM 241 TaxID=1128912 RepID=K6ZMI0_9ALTE|nr:5'-methylthioadenosine/adenosylhomocysteine nucleosidase [Paraglaciecola mesophila]GAC24570.1 5'-methylthioadenosine/S-adenosylhomocysteine nucleosidase [Paraglaciecola mesophila KMM 241]
MKIAILGAMDEEITLLKESISGLVEHQHAHLTLYTGQLKGADVVLVKCGIGKVAAAVATTIVVDKFAPDFVVNTGSAGGFDQALSIGDIVIANELVHHDADLTHFGYALGQCAGMPETYLCDAALIEAAEKSAITLGEAKTKRGLICTGDAFIGSDEAAAKLRSDFPAIAAAEMEGVAIGQTCHLLNVPFLVIRSLSDIAGKASTVSFQTYLERAAKHSAMLVMEMITVLPNQTK